MTRRLRQPVAPVVTLVALALAVPALAVASPSAVVRDCAKDGSLDGSYSDADKRAALGQIPADLGEYSDCRSIIAGSIGRGGPKAGVAGAGGGRHRRAEAAGKGRGDAPGHHAARKTPAEHARKRRNRARDATEAALGQRKFDPRNPAVLEASETANGLPLPILLALVALALLCTAGTLVALGRRKPGLVSGLLRGPLARFRR
jgi:hypothetical protein